MFDLFLENENLLNLYDNPLSEENNDIKVVECSDMFLIHQNIRSMRKNLDEFFAILQDLSNKPQLIILSEIFINESEIGEYEIDNYELFACCNNINRNAGVAAYIHKSIQYYSIDKLNFKSADTLQIDFLINNERYSLVCLYRLQQLHGELFLGELENYFRTHTANNMILIGDMNVDLLKNTTLSKDYVLLMASNGFESLINVPTRITKDTSTCIDHIFVRQSLGSTILFSSLTYDINVTDHCSTVLLAKYNFNSSTDDNQNHESVVTKLDFDYLNDLLSNTSWLSLYNISDVNEAYSYFIDKVNYCTSKAKKNLIIRRNNKLKKWISPNILKKIRVKNNLFKKLKKHPDNLQLREKYRKVKIMVQKEIVHTSKK